MSEQAGWLVRGLDSQQVVRVIGVDVTESASRVRRLHKLGPVAARHAAEGCAATGLLSAHIKGDERLSLQVQAERPRFAFTGEIDAEGAMRARLSPAGVPGSASGSLSGMLLGMKSDATREVYRGVTELGEQTLEQGLSDHLLRSSQIDSILRIHVEQGSDGAVLWAGGFYVERLPPHEVHGHVTPDEFRARFRPLLDRDPAEVVIELRAGLLGEGRFAVLDERNIFWRCRCGREKVEGMLYGLDLDMLRAMLVEDRGASIQCHFCNEEYLVAEQRLAEIVADVEGH